jgi:hypothetical protein
MMLRRFIVSKRVRKLVLLVAVLVAIPIVMGAIVLDKDGKRYGTVVAYDKDVNGVTTEYSDIKFIGGVRAAGIWIRATSAGSPDVSVYAEFSPTKTAADFSEIEGGSKVIDLTDTNVHNDFLIIKQSSYMRLRFVGNAGNPVDTFVDCVINVLPINSN